MNHEIIEKIRDGVDLMEVIKEYVPVIKKSGRTYKACCPFHQEKTPSFSISPDKGLFYCFGCQAGGDVFAFLMRIENLSFNEAARKLAERAGIDYQPQEMMSEEEKSRLKLYKIMDFAKDFYHKQLMSAVGDGARAYIKQRNLTKETAQKFELGYAAYDGLIKKATAAGMEIADLKKLGLAGQTGTDYFKNRLMFPIYNHRGEAVAFGGRIMGDGQPKYLNSPETPLFSKSRILYALNFAGPAIRKEERAILMEGYMDVIACHQAGVANCVAPLGTSFTPEHARLLKRYTNDVALVFDPDSAGTNAALRAALVLTEAGLYVRVITLPDDMDPDEYITAHGAAAFNKLIAAGRDIINFQADILLRGKKDLTPQDKTAAAEALVDTIKKQPDEIIKREWALTAADRLNVDADIILAKVTAKPTAPRYGAPAPAPQQPAPKAANAAAPIPNAEADLIKFLLKYPRYTETADSLEENHFKSPAIWRALVALRQLHKERPDIESTARALSQQIGGAEGDLIIRLSLLPLPMGISPAQDIAATAQTIFKAAMSEQLKSLQRAIKQYPTGDVPLDLQKQQIELIKKIKSN